VAHELVLAALRSPHRVRVTAAMAAGRIVGAAISAVPEDRRLLLAVGVAPVYRGRGLGSELVRRHVRAAADATAGPDATEPWAAAVTVAERDPFEPLARATRATIARRVLEGAGFRLEQATGPVGAADPKALVAYRG